MNVPDNAHNETGSPQVTKPKTEEKYREAIELYRTTRLSCAEICRTCKVTVSGFQRYLSLYHRDLLLARYNITCSKEEARHIKLGPLRDQLPATRAKYKDAIEACESLDYIEYNVSQIAREFGLDGTNLGRQLRTHYPGVIEWRETVQEGALLPAIHRSGDTAGCRPSVRYRMQAGDRTIRLPHQGSAADGDEKRHDKGNPRRVHLLHLLRTGRFPVPYQTAGGNCLRR